MKKITGPAFIYRDENKRFIGVKFTVRERDLGSTIKEAMENVNHNIRLPKGYTIQWAGEFENQVRATNRLAQVVPVSLLAIFIILFITFGNVKDAGLILVNVPFALIGGILALHITGINFGISAEWDLLHCLVFAYKMVLSSFRYFIKTCAVNSRWKAIRQGVATAYDLW